jgi:hypothetical protein
VIHLTLILVDFLTGLIVAGAWALLAAGVTIAGLVALAFTVVSVWRKRR